MSSALTPKEIVAELDKYIVGQHEAKRMVAVAIRNRWRRQQLRPDLKDEVMPKNIIMMGPTGVGKTEIARRLAKLCGSPFFKVDATKYTEVGYVGRDVESMVRDLMEIAISLVREEESARVRKKAEVCAEDRLLDLLLPPPSSSAQNTGQNTSQNMGHYSGQNYTGGAPASASPVGGVTFQVGPGEEELPVSTGPVDSTREKLRAMWRAGRLDERQVEMEVEESAGPQVQLLGMPGMDQMGGQLQDAFSRMFPARKKRRRFKLDEAYNILVEEECARLIDNDAVIEKAKERVQQAGIIFIDEIDKIAIPAHAGRGGADISREGVQRDLLPIVEGSVVTTKYGMIKTDHILFIAAGAFHLSKPADLIPELQGRFPLRVELSPLGRAEFLRILKEPDNALTIQYAAMMETEGISIAYTDDALEAIAAFAEETNKQTENIGARRLYTIMEKILSELSFDAPDRKGESIVIDSQWVQEALQPLRVNADLSRFIL